MKKIKHIKTWPWTEADERYYTFVFWVKLGGYTVGLVAVSALLMYLACVLSGCATPQSGPDCTAWRKVDDEWTCQICRIPGGEHRICKPFRVTDNPLNYDDTEVY